MTKCRGRHRLVQKYGICNISLINVPKQHQKYFRDIFTTVVEMKWRWCFLLFVAVFAFSWSFFAFIYYTIVLYHGDIGGEAEPGVATSAGGSGNINRPAAEYFSEYEERVKADQVEVAEEPEARNFYRNTLDGSGAVTPAAAVMGLSANFSAVPCVQNVRSFTGVFVFSFTTQSTVGYGYRYPTDECPLVLLTMSIQWVVGLISQTLMAGVIFAKLARPIKRAATILFSKHAVICMRDGKLCLLFRVGDMRKSLLAEAHVRLQVMLFLFLTNMIKKCITMEGELLPYHQFDMNVGYDTGLDRVFVIWPITICHEIDASSPLYELSKEALANAHFEIIVILEGVVESVGSTTQARTSYLPDEILWGKRFEKLVTHQRNDGIYKVDFGKFHNVADVPMPTCSAKELDQMQLSEWSNATATVPVPINTYSTGTAMNCGGGGRRRHSQFLIPAFTTITGSAGAEMPPGSQLSSTLSLNNDGRDRLPVGAAAMMINPTSNTLFKIHDVDEEDGALDAPDDEVRPTTDGGGGDEPLDRTVVTGSINQRYQYTMPLISAASLDQSPHRSGGGYYTATVASETSRRPSSVVSVPSSMLRNCGGGSGGKHHHRIIVEPSDDEQQQRFEDNDLDASLFIRAESPESRQRRKTSFQVRRGPDLF